MANRKFSDEELRACALDGLCTTEAARALNCSIAAIYIHARRLGLELANKQGQRPDGNPKIRSAFRGCDRCRLREGCEALYRLSSGGLCLCEVWVAVKEGNEAPLDALKSWIGSQMR